MDARLQRRIQRYGWDKAAEFYEDGWQESLAPVQDRLLNLANAQPGETVLDIACGSGLVTFPLAEAVTTSGRVIATDLSAAMVAIVETRASGLGLAHVEAFRADAEALSGIENNSVDLVTCALGLMYFPDPEAALREMLRVLKPGGRIVCSVWGARKNCGWADIFPIVDARVNSAVCPMFFRLGTGETLAKEMADADVSEVVSDRLSVALPFDDGEHAADAAFLGGPVALAYNRFDAAEKAAARKDYLDSIAPFFTQKGYRIPGEFVVVYGRKAVAEAKLVKCRAFKDRPCNG
ncbi:MAG: class I SAM-dependent methyltransferase [Hyphomonadaceae bacterium]|nr:class I SAM-dependent methyltransferase [Hyphomonadaceae bacterium]